MIDEIVPTTSGLAFIQERHGPLAISLIWPELGENRTRLILLLPGPNGTSRDGRAIFSENISWPLEPSIGTIGTVPDFELHSRIIGQLPNAGNRGCRAIKEGRRLYLNCYHLGGLLHVGDVHASQDDTEWSGSAATEVHAEVALRCRAMRNKNIPYIRIAKEESIAQLFAN